MQRLKKIMFALLISVIGLNSVNAAKSCSISEKAEFNKILPNIKANYEEKEKKVKYETKVLVDGKETIKTREEIQYYFDIVVVNLTEQFYLEISNDYDGETKTFRYSDSQDGIIIHSWEHLDLVTTFTIKVFTSEKTGCPGTLQKTLTVRTPRLNEYYDGPSCQEVPEFNLCQKYVTYDTMEYENFKNKIDAYINKKNSASDNSNEEKTKTTWEKIKDFVSDNKFYFIGGGIVLVIGTGVAIGLAVKKRRSIGL